MSTRSVTVVKMVYDLSPQIALYRHCDGYPSVAGAAILAALKDARCPEQVAGRLLSMVYDHPGDKINDRLMAIYHPTEGPEAHGNLAHVYIVVPVGEGWKIIHREGYGDSWTETEHDLASFAKLVDED